MFPDHQSKFQRHIREDFSFGRRPNLLRFLEILNLRSSGTKVIFEQIFLQFQGATVCLTTWLCALVAPFFFWPENDQKDSHF